MLGKGELFTESILRELKRNSNKEQVFILCKD